MAKGFKSGGRQKGTKNLVNVDVKLLAKQHTEAAITTLADIMNCEDCSETSRIQAAIALLDRAHGKAPQHIEQIIKERPEIALDEVARMILFSIRDKEERDKIEDKSIVDVELLPLGKPKKTRKSNKRVLTPRKSTRH